MKGLLFTHPLIQEPESFKKSRSALKKKQECFKIEGLHISVFQLFSKKKTQDLPESRPSGVDIQSLTRLKIQAEITMYNKMPTLELKGNPLDWRKKNGVLFSGLSEMAKKYLSCPPSSVESERLFSIGGNIITDKRTRLKAENSEMLMFLNYNLRLLPELQYF